MIVTLDSIGTVQDSGGSAVTSFNFNNITVNGPNCALLCLIQTASATAIANTLTATWDSGGTNQAMSQLGLKSSGSNVSHDLVWLYGLRNPTPGNKTLAVSWNNANTVNVAALSFLGADLTTNATCFKNIVSASANSASAALTVNSAVGDYAVALLTWVNISGMTPTAWWIDTAGLAQAGAHYQAGAAGSVSFSATGSSGLYAYVGVDIGAAPGPYDVVGLASAEW